MRTEDDLRAALATLERHAPDALAVLAAVRTRRAARQVINHRRLTRSLIATAAASVAAVTAAAVLSAGLFGGVAGPGPAAGTGTAAAVLRRLAVAAASQPTPALGPVLYTKEELWGPRAGSRDNAAIQQEWVSAAADYFVAGGGRAPASYTKLDPRDNPNWNWHNPATLPANLSALRRHLLSEPRAKSGTPVYAAPVTPDETVFDAAFEFMTTEPLPPAVRASMLRLIADIVQRSPRQFAVLGTVTDRAGHRDIAVASESDEEWTSEPNLGGWKLVHIASPEVVIYFFNPATGALLANEYARCTSRVAAFKAASARCTLNDYEQYLVIKAVRSLPRRASAAGSSVLAPYVFPAPGVIR